MAIEIYGRQHFAEREDLAWLANYFVENVPMLEVAPVSATAPPDIHCFVRPLLVSV